MLALSRRLVAGLVSGLGVALAAVNLYNAVGADRSMGTLAIDSVGPFVLAVIVAAAGVVLYRSDLPDEAATAVLLWTVAGAVAFGGTASLVVAYETASDPPLATSPSLAASATGGVLAGVLVGGYTAQTRARADLVASLQEASADLSAATTREEVCEQGVEIAHRVLGIRLCGVWLYDEEADALVPAAISDPGREDVDGPPTFHRGEGLAWQAYESGESAVYDDLSAADDVYNPETVIRSEMLVPLGDHGVLTFGATAAEAFDDLDQVVAKLLGTTMRAALDRAEREEALRKQRRELRRQNERLEEFTSVVSHDLRTPLSVVKGRLELADERLGPDDDIDAATDGAERMEALIDDLLTLARQGRSVGEVGAISLSDVAELAWPASNATDATLMTTDATVEADASRLRQLLENLFANAVTHGGDDVTVRVGPTEDGFYIADDGPGIPPEEREKVFETGYTDSEDGTGFGLSIVRRIADAHDWSVRVTEGESGGARFEFSFEGSG